MRSNLAPLLQNVNIFRGKLGFSARHIVFLEKVRQMQRASQPCRPRANDQYICFELFALCGHDFDFGDLIKEFRCAGRLTQFLKFIQRNSQLPEHLVEQWWADFAASMRSNGHGTAIRAVPWLPV